MSHQQKYSRKQQGYFLILAVFFIVVMGVMGVVMAYIFSGRAQLSVAQLNGLQAFYNAESGLEIGARLLTMPTFSSPARVTCASINGLAAVTNATLSPGTFTLTTVNSSPVYATTTLSAGETSSDTTIDVTSASGFAPSGRIIVDGEAIDYAAISGNSFIGVTRGTGGTLASSHASGAGVGQYQCTLDSQAGIPNLTSPSYQREIQVNVQLQDAWAVANVSGTNFILSRWNRAAELNWNALSQAGGSNAVNLNGVSMLSNADGWAVGNVASTNLIFLHWTGAAWSATMVARNCANQHLKGVSMVSSRQGWAVGARCGSGTSRLHTIMYWNGTTWVRLSATPAASPNMPVGNTNNQNLNAVHAIDTNGDGLADIGFAVGDAGQIVKYNGTNWVLDTSPTTNNLNGVYVESATEAWAVGNAGTIIKWNGSTWSTVSSPTSTQLNEIAMYDATGDGAANAGWAVGNSGVVVSYNGSTWSLTNLGSTNLFGVSIYNARDAWAVGASGTAYHWNGSAWASVATGVSKQLNSVSIVPPGQKPTSAWKQVFG